MEQPINWETIASALGMVLAYLFGSNKEKK